MSLHFARALGASFVLVPCSLAAQDFAPEQRLADSAAFVDKVNLADLDGDGDLDFIYTGHSRVGWYENRGALGWRSRELVEQFDVISSTSVVMSMGSGDLDGDGDVDLLVSSTYDGLGWYENLGGGHFGAAQAIAGASSLMWGLVVDDLDGDGLLDVAGCGALLNQVFWHRGLGGGAFGPKVVISTLPDFYYTIDAADVDGDGDLDLVAGGADRVVFYQGLGGGAFGVAGLESDAESCRDIAFGDVDGDGLLDVVWPSTFGADISWHRNLGGATFGAAQVLATGYKTPTNLEVADLDADGDDDFVLSTYETFTDGELHAFFNDGSGTFATLLVDTQVEVVQGLALGDVTRDGLPDIGSGVRDRGALSLYPNLGAGAFGGASDVTASDARLVQLVDADVDGDGDLDLIGHTWGADELHWYENVGWQGEPAARLFAPRATFFVGKGEVRDFDLFDVENDGDVDLVVTGPFGLDLHLNQGGGVFGPAQVIQGPSAVGWRVEAGDLDLDGLVDLAFAFGNATGYSGASKVGVLQNLGGGAFGAPVTLNSSIGVSLLEIRDVAGDAHPELLYVQGYYGIVTWVSLFGGTWGAIDTAPGIQWGIGQLDLGDYDGDGLRDLVLSGYNGLVYQPGLPGGGFGSLVSLSTQSHAAARLVDLDGDGVLDLLTGLNATYQFSGGVRWSRGLGGGAYAAPVTVEDDFLGVSKLELADLDGDGSLDVIAGDYYGGDLSWYANRMAADCDGNGTFDAVDVANGVVQDCDGNGVPDSCDLLVQGNDIDGDGQLDACVPPGLKAHLTEFSLAAGGAQKLDLQGPGGAALYIVVGSTSGTSPGTPFGAVTVPLVQDMYALTTVLQANTGPYTNTLGTLDASGRATAVITVPAGFDPALAGVVAHHALLIIQPAGGASFASNPVPFVLVP